MDEPLPRMPGKQEPAHRMHDTSARPERQAPVSSGRTPPLSGLITRCTRSEEGSDILASRVLGEHNRIPKNEEKRPQNRKKPSKNREKHLKNEE